MRTVIGVVILVGGLSLAKAVYDAGYGCNASACFSDNAGLSRIITFVSIGTASGIIRATD